MRIVITPADVGKRVSVRSRDGDGTGTHSMTDTLGHLLNWAGGNLTIQRRDGSIATIAEADLLAGKVLPHPPPTRRSERYPR